MAATPPEETETASRLDRLVALREMQERALAAGDLPAREVAAISREYRATLAEIDSLEPKKAEGDGIDEIAQRRATRRSSSAKGPARSKRSG